MCSDIFTVFKTQICSKQYKKQICSKLSEMKYTARQTNITVKPGLQYTYFIKMLQISLQPELIHSKILTRCLIQYFVNRRCTFLLLPITWKVNICLKFKYSINMIVFEIKNCHFYLTFGSFISPAHFATILQLYYFWIFIRNLKNLVCLFLKLCCIDMHNLYNYSNFFPSSFYMGLLDLFLRWTSMWTELQHVVFYSVPWILE